MSLILIASIIVGCTKYNITEPPLPYLPKIIPLEIGYHWQYLQSDIDSIGNVSEPVDRLTFSVANLLTGTNSFGYYAIEVTGKVVTFSSTIYMKNLDNGLHSLKVDNIPYVEELFLKFPSAVGESYTWSGFTVTILSVDTTITVPAGAYSCYHYCLSSGDTTSSARSQVNNLFYALEIGYVKSEAYSYKNSKRISGVLIELDSLSLSN